MRILFWKSWTKVLHLIILQRKYSCLLLFHQELSNRIIRKKVYESNLLYAEINCKFIYLILFPKIFLIFFQLNLVKYYPPTLMKTPFFIFSIISIFFIISVHPTPRNFNATSPTNFLQSKIFPHKVLSTVIPSSTSNNP